MNSQTLTIVIALLTSQVMVVIAQSILSKSKNGAEVANIKITGEVSVGEAWKKYANQIQGDFNTLRLEFEELSKQFKSLRQEKEELAIQTLDKDKKIIALEERIVVLEKEVEKYKGMADTIKDAAHTAIEDVASKVTST